MDVREFEKRIELEKTIMARELEQFVLTDSEKEKYFIGWHTTSLHSNRYQLKISLSPHYPDKCPDLYVVTPKILKKRGEDNGSLNNDGSYHSFHTLGAGPDGCVRICHAGSNTWDASRTCVGVALQGILWLEAYEEYLSTGKRICDTLTDWQKRGKQ